MIANSQLLESLLNLCRGGVSLDSHHTIVVISWVWGLFASLLASTASSELLEEFLISSETATKVLLALSTSVGMDYFNQSETIEAHKAHNLIECLISKEHKQDKALHV
jgi:hypothetical protein